MATNILRIDASARRTGSVSRNLTDSIIARLGATNIVTRDLATALPQITEAWVGANFTAADQRTAEQNETLRLSDQLIEELRAADTIVIGLPVYNFGVPASFKAWIDQITRVGETFAYGENGPEGKLNGKNVIVAVAAGGTKVGSDYDFATGYVRHILGFIGITDVRFVAADQLAVDADTSLKSANEAVAELRLAA